MSRCLKEKVERAFFYFSFFIIAFFFVFFIAKNTVDIPYWDQWALAHFFTDDVSFFEIITHQANEHHIGISLLIMRVLARLTNWSQTAEVIFITSSVFATLFLLLLYKRKYVHRIEFLDIVIPLAILNIFQYENFLAGIQIAYMLPFFFLVLFLFVIRIKNEILRNSLVTVMNVLVSYSIFHGLFLPVIFIVSIAYEYFFISRKSFIIKCVTIGINTCIIVSYFLNYTPSIKESYPLSQAIQFFLRAVGGGFFYQGEGIVLPFLFTVVSFIYLFITIFLIFRRKIESLGSVIAGLSFIIFSLLFIIAITFARAGKSPTYATSSRYIGYEILFTVGLFFLSYVWERYGKMIRLTLLSIFVIHTMYYLPSRIEKIEARTDRLNRVLQCYKGAEYYDFHRCYYTFALYPDKKFLDANIPKVFSYKKINDDLFSPNPVSFVNRMPRGKKKYVSFSVFSESVDNLEQDGDLFSSLNETPRFDIQRIEKIHGVSWKSSVKGHVRLFFLFEGMDEFQEGYSSLIQPIEKTFYFDKDLLEESYGKKLRKLQIQPTDTAEEFEMKEFVLYD